MEPPSGFPSYTSTWHNSSYASISPTLPALSLRSKTAIITGGGRGLGVEFAHAFALAGAAHVVLIGRTEGTLHTTQTALESAYKDLKVSIYAADVADTERMQRVAAEVGAWDILMLNAGIQPVSKAIAQTDVGVWWRAFETNVKGALVTTHAFLPYHRPSSSIIGISAALAQFAPEIHFARGSSAYTASKMAQLKMLEHLAAEVDEDVFVASVHPGVVDTDMPRDAGMDLVEGILDDAKLPAHFIVWLVSPEARFLKGKFVWANWDVEELKAKKGEIQASQVLTSNVLGWPFVP